MEPKEAKLLYPQAYHFLYMWCEREFTELPEEVQEVSKVRNLMDKLFSHPRYLYDFFDYHEVYVEVYRSPRGSTWSWELVGPLGSLGIAGGSCHSRLECEGSALMEAFKYLEIKLKQ